MTQQQLDELYTRACAAMTTLGEDKTPLFLARLVLLLMQALDDPQRAAHAIEAAQEGL